MPMPKLVPFKFLILATLISTSSLFNASDANALVVVEEKAGVNIIRNVKTYSAFTRQVRDKRSIGSSTLLKPERILLRREIVRCNRRLRTTTVKDSATIGYAGAVYCQ